LKIFPTLSHYPNRPNKSLLLVVEEFTPSSVRRSITQPKRHDRTVKAHFR